MIKHDKLTFKIEVTLEHGTVASVFLETFRKRLHKYLASNAKTVHAIDVTMVEATMEAKGLVDPEDKHL